MDHSLFQLIFVMVIFLSGGGIYILGILIGGNLGSGGNFPWGGGTLMNLLNRKCYLVLHFFSVILLFILSVVILLLICVIIYFWIKFCWISLNIFEIEGNIE